MKEKVKKGKGKNKKASNAPVEEPPAISIVNE